jgi:arabinofuranosyltransferase
VTATAAPEQAAPRTTVSTITGRRMAQAALLAAPVMILAVQGWTHRWIADDGFIDLRVVREIAAGHGPVFDTGQRVEAFTGPLWVAVLSIADIVTPLRLEWLAVGLGIACTAAGLGLAISGSARLVRQATDDGAWLVPAGALVPLALFPMWYFASSGLETGLVFGWLGLCLWLLARWSGGGRLHWSAAIVLGLGWLIRPELGVLSVLILIVLLASGWNDDRWRDRVLLAAEMLALPALYQIFRMGYYASTLPNTALAKEASLARWSQGWRYLTHSLGPFWLWVPALALVAGAYVPLVRAQQRAAHRRASLVVLTFALGSVLDAGYIVRVGGDYISARLLLPAVFMFIAPVAVIPLRPRFAAALAVAPWALVCALSLRAADVQYVPPNQPNAVTVDDLGWGRGGSQAGWFSGNGVYYNFTKLRVHPAAELHVPAIAGWGIGISSYAFGPRVEIIDLLGLADRLDSHFQLVHRGMPGHEKPMGAPWTAARLVAPDSAARLRDFAPPPLVNPLVPWPTTQAEFERQLAWARAALQCPAIRGMLTRATAPMTPGRFVSNFFHAYSDTRMRIPPDPERAYHRYCGPGHPPGT